MCRLPKKQILAFSVHTTQCPACLKILGFLITKAKQLPKTLLTLLFVCMSPHLLMCGYLTSQNIRLGTLHSSGNLMTSLDESFCLKTYFLDLEHCTGSCEEKQMHICTYMYRDNQNVYDNLQNNWKLYFVEQCCQWSRHPHDGVCY